MAEESYCYFASVFPLKTSMKSTNLNSRSNLIPLSSCDSTEEVVIKALDKIKGNETPGPDCIAPKD